MDIHEMFPFLISGSCDDSDQQAKRVYQGLRSEIIDFKEARWSAHVLPDMHHLSLDAL